MTQITEEHLLFLSEAKQAFEDNDKFHTYRNDNDTLIALRTGADRDCIEIYELSNRVANFVQMIDVE